jgi:hypothetical protein
MKVIKVVKGNNHYQKGGSNVKKQTFRLKKLLAVLLSAAMIFTMGPQASATVSANGGEGEAQGGDEQKSAYEQLVLGEETDVHLEDGVTEKWFGFTPDSSGWYTLTSSGDYDTVAGIYSDPEGTALEEDDDSGEDSNFMLGYALKAGQTYYYKTAMCYEDIHGSFTVELQFDASKKVVETAKIKTMPRTVFYSNLDNSIDYSGLSIDVTYSDDTSGILTYGSYYSKISVKCDVPKKNGRFVNGTYHASIYYTDQKITEGYDIEVKDFSETSAWDGSTAEGTLNAGDLYKYVPSADGYYLIAIESDDYYSYARIRTVEDGNEIYGDVFDRTLYLPNGKRGQYYCYYLEADTEYCITVSCSDSGYYSQPYKVSCALLGSSKLENITNGYNFMLYTPEKNGIYNARLSAVKDYYSVSYDMVCSQISPSAQSVNYIDQYAKSTGPGEDDMYMWDCTYSYNLEAGKTYLFGAKAYTSSEEPLKYSMWVGSDVDKKVSEKAPLTDVYASGDKVLFEAPADGYYRLTLASERSYAAFSVKDNYVINSDVTEYSNDGDTYYYNMVFYADKGTSYVVTPSGLSEGDSYTLSVKSVPGVDHLVVKTPPTKTDYVITDSEGDYSGLVVTIYYTDGTSEDVAYDSIIPTYGVKYNVNDFYHDFMGLYSPGEHSIGISLLNTYESFKVQVEAVDASSFTAVSAGTPVDVPYDEKAHTYKFEPSSTGMYTISNTDDVYILNEDWSNAQCARIIDSKIIAYCKAGSRYIIVTGPYSDGTLSIEKNKAEDFTPGSSNTVTVQGNSEYKYYRFVPEESAEYTIYSEGDYNTYVQLFSEGKLLAVTVQVRKVIISALRVC